MTVKINISLPVIALGMVPISHIDRISHNNFFIFVFSFLFPPKSPHLHRQLIKTLRSHFPSEYFFRCDHCHCHACHAICRNWFYCVHKNASILFRLPFSFQYSFLSAGSRSIRSEIGSQKYTHISTTNSWTNI